MVFSIIKSDILNQQKVLIDNYTEGFNFTIKTKNFIAKQNKRICNRKIKNLPFWLKYNN